MKNEGIFINDRESIPYSNTNLPKENFTFTDRMTIYWLVEIRTTVRNDQLALAIKVKDYTCTKIHLFHKQVKKSDVPFMIFERLNQDLFFEQCVSYIPNRLLELFYAPPKPPSSESPRPIQRRVSPEISKSYPVNEPIISESSVEFRHNLSDITIIDGAVQFSKSIKELTRDMVFTITNPFLRTEFDPIKVYFSKKLGRKTFTVTARIKMVDWKIVEVTASSKEIDQINEDFLRTIRYAQVRSLKKIARDGDGKKLYPLDDVFKHAPELEGNVFRNSVDDVIKVLTDDSSHRNSHQLAYLAQSHANAEDVVYITLSPYFGFLFCLLGSDHRHYVWELLDTHATYIWSFAKATYVGTHAVEVVSLSINKILAIGRNAYKKAVREESNSLNYLFLAIDHLIDDTGAHPLFEKWLAEVTERTTM